MASVGVMPSDSRTFSVAAFVAGSIRAWTVAEWLMGKLCHRSNTFQAAIFFANVVSVTHKFHVY